MTTVYYKRLRELREDNDYTQKDIAQILKITQPQYNLYEKGKRDLPTDILKRICQLYKTSSDYILELPRGLKYP